MSNIQLSKDIVNKIDLQPLEKYINWCEQNKHFFNLEAGKEHYKLLAHLSNSLNDATIIDIGTYFGFSALAMSMNEKNRVLSYDIFDWIPDHDHESTVKHKENIDIRLTDCCDDIMDLISADLICLDISPHDGIQEEQIYSLLKKYKYKGLLYFNNVNLSNEMKEFKNSITHKVYDVTAYGHYTGSCLVVFDESKYNITID